MQINILAFGIAKEVIQGSQLKLKLDNPATVADVKKHLCRRFPEFERLASLRIAVNNEYADDDHPLKEQDEVVIIPPVSGG